MFKKSLAIFIAATFGVSGCASLSRGELPDRIPSNIAPIDKPVAVVGMSDDMNVDLRGIVDEDMFISTHLPKSEALPDIRIQPFSVSNATVYDVMRTILDGKGMPFSIDTEHPGANVMRRSISATNVAGSLKTVMDTLSDSVGFHYHYAAGVLHVTPDRQYISKIPPINELFDSLPPMLKTLGATDVFIDKTSRTVTYRASKPTQDKAASYLRWLRDNKHMVVYETYIAEVVLDDASSTGIQWNNFGWTGSVGKTPVSIAMSGTSAVVGAAASGSIGIGTIFNGSHFSLNVLSNFLKTQGTVNQITKIPMMLITGGSTAFHDGSTNYYVSSIGSPTIASTGQVIQGTSQLSPLITGIDMKLSGDISDGTIYTSIEMAMVTLTGFMTFPAGAGQTLQAPITTDRKINTSTRVRAGDAILIAGINYDTFRSNLSGLPGKNGVVSLATDNSRAVRRAELVVVMRPKIVQFSRNAALNAEPFATQPNEKGSTK